MDEAVRGLLQKMKLEIGTYFAFFSLAFLALHRIVLSPGTIGVSYDWSIPPYPEQLRMWIGNLTWALIDSSLGVENLFVNLWSSTLVWAVGVAGLGGEFLSKLYVLFAVSGSGVAMFYLLRRIGLKWLPSFAASIIYMFNPFTFNRLAAGHTAYVYGMVFSPLAVAYFIKAVRGQGWREWLRATLSCALFYSLSTPNIHGILPLSLIMTCYALVTMIQGKMIVFRHIVTVFASMTLAFLTHFGLLFNLMDYGSKVKTGVLVSPRSVAWISGNTDILRASVLDGWTGDAFLFTLQRQGLDFWFISALTITALSLSVAGFAKKDLHTAVWATLTTVFILIIAGQSTWPGAVLWDTVYVYARPLAAFYGDAYHLAIVPAIGIAILLGKFADIRLRELKGNQTSGSLRFRGRSLMTFMLLILTASYSVPSLTMYAESLQTYVWHPAYRELYDRLVELEGRDHYRMMWIPTIAYAISYKGLKLGGLDPMIRVPPMASFPQQLGTARLTHDVAGHEAYVNLVVNAVSPYTDRYSPLDYKTKYLGQLLALSGVRYVALRSDAYTTQRFDVQYNVSRRILDEQRGINLISETGPIRLYENSEALPLVYASSLEETSLVARSNLIPLTYLTSETDVLPRQKAFIFSNLLTGRELQDHLKIIRNVVLDDEGLRGLQFSLLPGDYRPSLEAHLETSKYWFRGGPDEGLISSPPGAATRATLCFTMASSPGTYEVWVKALHSPLSKSLSVRVDGRVFELLTTAPVKAYYWVRLGEVSVDRSPLQVDIEGEGQEGIASLVAAPPGSIKEAELRVNSFLAGRRVITIMEAEKASNVWPLAPVGSSASGGATLNSTGKPMPVTFRFYSPSGGVHEIYLRVRPSLGVLNLTVGSEKSIPSYGFQMSAQSEFSWIKFASHMSAGWHALDISSADPGNLLDVIAVKHPYQESAKNPYSFQFEKVSRVKFVSRLEAAEPSFIVLSYNYLPHWTAVANGRVLEKLVVNGFAQAFYVPGPGTFQVTIEYTRQQAFETARAISLTVIALVLSGILLTTIGKARSQVK